MLTSPLAHILDPTLLPSLAGDTCGAAKDSGSTPASSSRQKERTASAAGSPAVIYKVGDATEWHTAGQKLVRALGIPANPRGDHPPLLPGEKSNRSRVLYLIAGSIFTAVCKWTAPRCNPTWGYSHPIVNQYQRY